ncbi:MAG: ATP-binding protein [Paludibacteraceae bacterium]|nr:ATP-binding protein [Paludibacteraceae bacterium]
MIGRFLQTQIESLLGSRKAIILMGARQVGKSTLLQLVLDNRKDVLWLNGDNQDIQALFTAISAERIRTLMGDKRVLVIDEAQRIRDIGLQLKIIIDQLPDVQVIATGSSSFELASKVNEPLTGRKREFKLYPLTFNEMASHTTLLEELRLIPHRLVYGYYPEVVATPGQEPIILKELTDSYLYRDILTLDKINKSDKLVLLLKALAMQIGSQVSYNELSGLVGIDAKTIERYITILEQSYIIFRLGSFSRNLRNELKFSKKIYFWDMGIRNAVIGNFAHAETRSDIGALWENFAIAERMKQIGYRHPFAQSYFWRTKQQKEIDYIEEKDGELHAFEFKWNEHKTPQCPSEFTTTYPTAKFSVVTPQNIDEFLRI